MPDDSQNFKINIETTASGDGAQQTEEALKDLGVVIDEVADKQDEAGDAAKGAAEAAGKAAAASTGIGLAIIAITEIIIEGYRIWREEAAKTAEETAAAEKAAARYTENTEEGMRKLAQAAADFDAQQHNAISTWDRIFDAIDRVEKKIQGAIARQREMFDAESDTDKARINAAETAGALTHEEAARGRAAIDASKRADEFNAKEAQAYETEQKLARENRERYDQLRAIKQESDAARERGAAAAALPSLQDTAGKALERQDAANAEISRLKPSLSTGAGPEVIAEVQRRIEEQEKILAEANEQYKQTASAIEAIHAKYQDMQGVVEETKRANGAMQNATTKTATIEKQIADASAAILESQKNRLNNAKVAEERERAAQIKDASSIEQASKRDAAEAAKKSQDSTKPIQKGIADAAKKVAKSEQEEKKTADSLAKLLAALEQNKSFKGGAIDQAMQQLIAQLKADPGNQSALTQLGTYLKQLSATRNQEAAGTVALMQQMLATEKAHVAETAKLKAELEALKSQVNSLNSL